jgi:hypothetical protein
MHRIVVRSAPWLVLALMGGPTALAQEPPPPLPPEPAVEPMPAPEPAVEPVAKGDEAPVEAPPPEAEAPSGIAGWFRIDSDLGGLQLWAGASHPLGDGLALATDIYVYGTVGEFDIGPAFSLGPAVLTPMVGLQIDWSEQKAISFVPQLYTIVDGGSLYFESWIQVFFNDMFVDDATNIFHTRDFLLFKASDYVAIGLEVDLNYAFSNAPTDADGEENAVVWLPVGPHLKLSYGEGSTLELFAGYDLAAESFDANKLAGRFTFVQTW